MEWAGIVRKLGKIPTVFDWEKHARWSTRPLTSRFRTWGHVPHCMLEHARRNGLEGEWKDVMDIAAANVERRRGLAPTFGTPSGTPPRSRVLQNQPILGMPLLHPVMLFAPTNEAGVMVLFAAMARELGYAITRVQAECPDCEAVRTVDQEHCQPVRIEFEKGEQEFCSSWPLSERCRHDCVLETQLAGMSVGGAGTEQTGGRIKDRRHRRDRAESP